MTEGIRTGLVMEGGAMRGMFTAGVIDILMEKGIGFDGAIGVSAGATFGCNFKSHQIGRAIRYNRRFCRDWRYCSFRSLIRTGDLYGAEFCYRTLPDELDLFDTETYSADPMPFYVVCTDCESGRPVYHAINKGDHEDLDWMRASASMPVVSRPVELEGRKYLDGGVSDSIPLEAFEKMGYARNVVILTQPDSYRKEKGKMAGLIGLMVKKYPGIAKALETRPDRYNAQVQYIREREAAGAAFVIRPDAPLNIGSVCHDPDELMRVYRIGRKKMTGLLEDLKAFLQ